ncbi:MAG: aminotransferase class V-fold PLP-dependent enzyme [bacterium]|nr:aminotransferase class V-fold PLP-dependent enzyme [bacterium]
MGSIYEQLGIQTIVNAAGPVTRLSGSIMPPEVADAMREASQHCVDIAELQAWAGGVIAEHTGAEAGYVTSGAAAGQLLGIAACVVGLDPGKMNRLPDTAGMKDEVIMPRSHRNFYDHAIRAVGIKLVEVGIADRFSGAGVRDTEAWEIADAITERTAAVAYVAHAHSRPSLFEVVRVAHEKGVPVVVDAAGQLPPQANLKRFIAEGADLVCFSGGKALRGPQSSGILCGKRELVSSVALQHLDQDVYWDLWNPPPSLIDKGQLPGAPQHGIGRPCKVGKEEIVGLITALRLFVEEGDEVRRVRWEESIVALAKALEGLPHVRIEKVVNPGRPVPMLRLVLDEESAGVTAVDLVQKLMLGSPSVHVSTGEVYEGVLIFSPMCLREGDVEKIAKRLGEVLQ